MDSSIDWTFGGTWPYEPHWFEAAEGRNHHVDEGPRDGRPVVLVHDNPTWAYLWLHFLSPLVFAGPRVIVPDPLGLGRPEKPDDPSSYRVPRHALRLEQFLESLDLSEATVVPQDWGGPIGLAWAARHPERPGSHERAACLAPHQSSSSRTGILVFPREIPAGPAGPASDFLDSVHEGLKSLREKLASIAWAMKDVGFLPSLLNELWLADFPKAEVLRFPDAGHDLQEDAHEEIVPALLRFLRSA